MESIKEQYYFTKELVAFAQEFSSAHKQFKGADFSGSHTSAYEHYHIEVINESVSPTKFPRVHNNTGDIQIPECFLNDPNVDSDFVFFTILWTQVQKTMRNEQMADTITLHFYFTINGRPKRSIIHGFEYLLDMVPNELNARRKTNVNNILTQYK